MLWCHYVPQFYMRGFAINDKQVVRYDKKTGKVTTPSIESFCAKNGFFCFDEGELENLPESLLRHNPPDGVIVPPHLTKIGRGWVEDAMGCLIEGLADASIKKIVGDQSLKNLSIEEIQGFLGWLCWLFVANPNSLAADAIKATAGRIIPNEFPSSAQRLEFYFNLRSEIEPYFVKRKWLLQKIDSAEGSLLSSDRPVMLGGEKSLYGPPHLETHTIFFPLSPDLLLIGVKNSEWGMVHQPLDSSKEAIALATALTVEQANGLCSAIV